MTLAATGNLQRRDFDTLEGESEEAAAEAAMAPVSSESQHLVERATTTTNTTVSPRQRIELLSWAPAPAGSKWSYSWKSHLGPNVKAGNTFFHIFQLLRRVDDGGAVVTLSLKNGYAIINDVERGCTNCTSVAMSKISGRTIRHYLDVTYGTNGTLSYKIVDVSKPGSVLLQYNATGEMGSQSSVKFGAYRAVYYGMSSVTNYVGDCESLAFQVRRYEAIADAIALCRHRQAFAVGARVMLDVVWALALCSCVSKLVGCPRAPRGLRKRASL